MLIQRAALLDGRTADIRVQAQIAEVGDRLTPQRGEDVFDAAGGTCCPACMIITYTCIRRRPPTDR